MKQKNFRRKFDRCKISSIFVEIHRISLALLLSNTVLALTETWLSSNDSNNQIISDICPTGYELYNVPRGRRGGGVVLVYKNLLRFQKQSCIKTKFKSFEFTDFLMKHSSSTLCVIIIYRPPPSKSNTPFVLQRISKTSGGSCYCFRFIVDGWGLQFSRRG